MATVTITLEDLDLDLGSYEASIDVKEAQIDDGQATAAHFAGNFIYNMIHTAEFRDAVWQFAQELVASNPGATIGNENPSSQETVSN